MTISIEDLLRSHGVGSGSSGNGVKVVKQPTEPTTGLRDGLVWINESKDGLPYIYLSGAFQSLGTNIRLSAFEGEYKTTEETNEVPITVPGYVPDLDILFVVQNTTQLTRGIHYTLDKTNKKIIKKEGTWAADTTFAFTTIAGSPDTKGAIDLVVYEDHVTVPAGTLQVPFNIGAYNPQTDYLRVHQRNLEIFKDKNWYLHANGTAIVLMSPTRTTEEFHFSVQKKMRTLNSDQLEPINQEQLVNHEKSYVKHPGVATTSNVGNDYSVTLNPAPVGYVQSMGLVLTINADSTGAATINVNGLGAKSIVNASGESITELKANGIYTLRYNEVTGNFITQGEGGGFSNAEIAQARDDINALAQL